MKYPEIKTNLLFSTEKPFPTRYVETFLINGLKDSKITIALDELDRSENYFKGEWISSFSFINLYITDSFIIDHFVPSTDDYKHFIDQFKEFIQPIAKITTSVEETEDLKRTRPYAPFSAFYKSKDDFIFRFIFQIGGNESDYVEAIVNACKLIIDYNSEDPKEIQGLIKETHTQSNKIKYLNYSDKKWIVLNPLIEVCKELNNKYRKDNDFRIKKPTIIMHNNDFRKYFILDTNWVISSDKLETFMIRPNDVSLYSNICDKNLVQAEKFYSETITPRYEYFSGRFPNPEKQSKYYDYFELIINSIIFAYTALEAFANICIPDSYEYTIEKDGIKTIYSKEAIEKKFTLRDKFKNVLRSILNTPDPTRESWWDQFIILENLRDELIHTKQSISEERYSRLLSFSIFKNVRIYKEIIKYYGYYIFENKKELLDEFPYNLGYDELFPGLTNDEGYERSYRVLYNIPDDKNNKKGSS
jgi:hypothetical protein